MQRAFIGWSAAALAALVLASPAEARPRTADGDSSATGSTATARPAPSPAPAPSSPAPVVSGSGGARSAPAAPTTVRAQSRRGERRAPSGGDRTTAAPRTRGTGSTAAATSSEGSDDERRAVRRGDRARDGRTAIGRAAPRTRPRPTIPSWAYHRPSYWYGYNSLGLGYFYYDPYYWGYPGHYGYGYYGPRSYGPAYGGYGGGYGGGYYVHGDRHLGNVRLKVKPRDAEVRVDGYYVGVVDQYDGIFQRLTLESGPHRIEISKPGFEPVVVDIRVLPYDTVTYKGTLEPQ